MTNRKENISYTFTVEGDTEKWYLDWLEKQINACSDAAYKVSIASKKEPNPMSYAKTVNRMTKPQVIHLCDVESNEPDEVKRFQAVLSELNEAKKEKKIQYTLGYSNFTFELWMILHKSDCNRVLTHKKQYLDLLNRAYGTKFASLKQYKEKDEFSKCLNMLTLKDVCDAVLRADKLMAANERDEKAKTKYKGFSYYTDNPSLTIWEPIRDILKECRLLC